MAQVSTLNAERGTVTKGGAAKKQEIRKKQELQAEAVKPPVEEYHAPDLKEAAPISLKSEDYYAEKAVRGGSFNPDLYVIEHMELSQGRKKEQADLESWNGALQDWDNTYNADAHKRWNTYHSSESFEEYCIEEKKRIKALRDEGNYHKAYFEQYGECYNTYWDSPDFSKGLIEQIDLIDGELQKAEDELDLAKEYWSQFPDEYHYAAAMGDMTSEQVKAEREKKETELEKLSIQLQWGSYGQEAVREDGSVDEAALAAQRSWWEEKGKEVEKLQAEIASLDKLSRELESGEGGPKSLNPYYESFLRGDLTANEAQAELEKKELELKSLSAQLQWGSYGQEAVREDGTVDEEALEARRSWWEETEKAYDEAETDVAVLTQLVEKLRTQERKERIENRIRNSPDFAELSQYQSTKNGKEKEYLKFMSDGYMTETGYDDLEYEYLNAVDQEAVDAYNTNEKYSRQGSASSGREYLRELTPEELEIYNYLTSVDKRDGTNRREEYLEEIKTTLTARRAAKEATEWAEMTKKDPVGTNIKRIFISPLRFISAAGQVVDYLDDGKIDENADYNKFSRINSTVLSTSSEMARTNFGPAGGVIYDVSMGFIDNTITRVMDVALPGLGMVTMASGSFADSVISGKERGLSDEKALGLGAVAGTMEYVTEKVGLEKLLSIKNPNTLLKELRSAARTEVGEETLGFFVNEVFDLLVSQDKSEWQTAINGYVLKGKTKNEAMALATMDRAEELGKTALSSYLTSFFTGGTRATRIAIQNYCRNLQIESGLGKSLRSGGDENMDAFIHAGLQSGENTQAHRLAQSLRQKLQNDTVSDREIGRTCLAIVQELDRENSSGKVPNGNFQQETGQLQSPETAGERDWTRLYESAAKYGVPTEKVNRVQRIASLFGSEVEFYSAENPLQNGFYSSDGVLHINANSQNPVAQIFGHELTHSLEKTGSYGKLQQLVFDRIAETGGDLAKMREEKRADYAEQKVVLDDQGVDREITAAYMENLLTDEAAIRSLVRGDKKIGQRFLDWIDRILAKLGNENAQERAFLAKARQMYSAALQENQEATTNARQETSRQLAETEGDSSDNVPKAELPMFLADEEYNSPEDVPEAQLPMVGVDENAQFSISGKLDRDLQRVLQGTFPADKSEVYIGETSNFLIQEIGARSLRVTMPANKAYSAMVTEEQARADGKYDGDINYHGLGAEGLRRALVASETPVAAFADTGDVNDDRRNRIVLVTDERKNGNPIAVIQAVEMHGQLNGKRIDANKVITSYDKDRLASSIERAAVERRLLYLDKTRSQTILAGGPADNGLAAMRDADFKANIRDFWENVKWKKSPKHTYSSSEELDKGNTDLAVKLKEAGWGSADENSYDPQDLHNWGDIRELELPMFNPEDAPYIPGREPEGLNDSADLRELQLPMFLADEESNGSDNENQYSFGGEHAKKRDQSMLETAIALEAEGEDNEAIRRETGWFRGMDGKWRFEIDDSRMKLKNFDPDKGADKMYEANVRYAEAQMKMLYAKNLSKEQRLMIQEYISARRIDPARAKALYQQLSESSAAEVFREIYEAQEEYDAAKEKNMLKLGDVITHPTLFQNYPALRKVPVSFTPTEKLRGSNGSTGIWISRNLLRNPWQLSRTLLHEIQHEVQRIEGFALGSSPEHWEKKIQEGYSRKWAYDDQEMDSWDLYSSTAGEIEARNTADRMPLSPEKRTEILPDLGDENTVFAEDDGQANFAQEADSIKDQLREHAEELNIMEPVSYISAPDTLHTMNKSQVMEWVMSELKKTGFKVDRQGFGTITFSEKELGQALKYLSPGSVEIAVYPVIPAVLKRGVQIAEHEDHKGRGYGTITFAAPVSVNGKVGNMAVVVKQTTGNAYKMHRLLTPEGKLFVLP